MAFAPTPPRNNAPSQLLSLNALLATVGGSSAVVQPAATVAITNAPATGTVGVSLMLSGTVSPTGTSVRVGFSSSRTTAPTGWSSATVGGSGWTANLVPSTAGVFYVWAEQTNLNSVQATSAAVTISSANLGTGSVTFTSPPSTGTVGTPIALAGTVSPSGSAIQVGVSTSATVAPTSWSHATVNGLAWTASLTPSSAGTYFLWAEQTNATSVQIVSAALTIVTGGGSALTYSLIAGSGNGSLSAVTLTTAPLFTTDWTTSIAHGATDVAPNVSPSAMGAIAACKFWFDSSATNLTPGTYGNGASFNNGEVSFYAANTSYGTPTAVPAAPSVAGTYYGKYAMYDSTGILLGVFVTSAITIT